MFERLGDIARRIAQQAAKEKGPRVAVTRHTGQLVQRGGRWNPKLNPQRRR